LKKIGNYIWSLEFGSDPDYSKIVNLFERLLKNAGGGIPASKFDWEEKSRKEA